ncbi:unnamed protein product [Microthlaspi erraticum]|uniref:F-box domain-containing protein n=1 Tax=Microthlaspi erraticum TaxID=1685480 RepID=A0A6D2L1V2_9BRAS|nr:unnamed protein product [Microthlaspi erraticum]
MSSPPRRSSQTSESTQVQSLPYDLLISSVARIPRVHHPALSFVSKSFQSLLASPEIYETRSLIGRTESCLYVCLKVPPCHSRWFTLCRKPNRTIANEKSSGHLLVPVAHSQGVVAVGSSIYAIGGPSYYSPSTSVWVLDCHCHVWRKGPSMLVKRRGPAANVVDGKIYVAGGCEEINSSNWMEVFDPKTQTWELVADGVAYKPKEDRREAIGRRSLLDRGWSGCSDCVIDNVPCCFGGSDIRWYSTKRQVWMNMKGLIGLPKLDSTYGPVRMVDYGGKLAVFWTSSLRASGYGYKEKTIWCAVIALERRNGGQEIWGTVEWTDPVHTIPAAYNIVSALAATV